MSLYLELLEMCVIVLVHMLFSFSFILLLSPTTHYTPLNFFLFSTLFSFIHFYTKKTQNWKNKIEKNTLTTTPIVSLPFSCCSFAVERKKLYFIFAWKCRVYFSLKSWKFRWKLCKNPSVKCWRNVKIVKFLWKSEKKKNCQQNLHAGA